MKVLSAVMMAIVFILSCSRGEQEARPTISNEQSIFEGLKERIAKDPNDAEAWYHLADLYERSELFRDEVDALKKVVAIQPKRGYAYVRLGNAYNRLGQHEDAARNFVIALKYQPKNPLIYNNLAVSYGKIGKMNEEIAALEKAIALRPKYATARYNLGIALLKKGDRQGALKQHQELKKFDEGTASSLKKEIDAKRS